MPVKIFFNRKGRDFPGNPVVKTLCSQCRGTGSIPGQRKSRVPCGAAKKIEKGTLLLCWWECKLMQPLWRTVRRFLKKLKIELPYNPNPTPGHISRKNSNSKKYMEAI